MLLRISMRLIHHAISGTATQPIVLVHGFGSGLTDRDSQVSHQSSRHRTVAVDLRAHGSTPGSAADGSMERYGADVAELMRGGSARARAKLAVTSNKPPNPAHFGVPTHRILS